MTGEHNPDLEALAGEVLQVDGNVKKPVPEDQGAEPGASITIKLEVSQNEIEELSGLIGMVAGLFVPLLPSLATIYTPDTCTTLAAATLPVMKKHGWSVPGVLSKWGEEIALAAIALPLSITTWKAVSADIAAANVAAQVAAPGHPGQIPDSAAQIAEPAQDVPMPDVQPRG